ncbi:MAG: hypothetical protein JNJ57_15795, partial [Saprospiraceae bacterium]|nr:hypothetical protein [Saprospiraceae bacterium]
MTEHDAVLENGGAIWLVAEKRSKPGSGVLLKLFPGNLQPEYMVDVPIPIGIYSRIQKSTQGRFWISGSNSTFALFDPVSKSFQSFDHSSVTGFKEASFTLHEDEHGAVWIGTPHGLVKFNRDEGKIRYELYKNNPQNLQSLNCNFILSFLDDPYQPDKFCWIGTKGGGLNLLNKHSGEVKHFTQKEGLPNNVVYGILLDADSCLWLSTNRGLSKFNSKANVFSTFYNVDGLQDNEFNTLSYAKDQSGRMYFGGVNGITAFYPKEIQATTIAPKVEITDFWVNGKMVNTSSFSKNAMNLEYEQNQVTFKFAAMDFAAPQHNRYKHRLLGVDAHWTFPSTSNSAAYVHLSPGTYVFEVMTGGSKGIWSGEPARFEFTILPPWWQTWPAYAMYFLALVSLIWAIIHFQVNKIRLENKLKFEQKEAERLAGLDKIKTDFFSGVTHEFRTPITLILEPIRQLKKRLKKEEDIETAEMIERNSERLLTYVNQLLDLSKLEAGQMPLDLRFCDPVELTNLAIKQFGSAFADRDIHLNLNMPEASSLIYLDESKWAQILNNLVSNAIKFSHNGGQITVSLSLTPLQFNTTQLLQLIVSDEGIGIQPEDLPRVFDRFFQAKHGKGGSGIGLALTQELVEKMEGSISVESEVGKGASFKVVVPCSVWNGSVDQPAPMHAGVNPAAMIEKVHVDALQTNHPTVGQPGTEPYLIL